MDNMFQLRQNMTQEEKLRFEQESLQQEQNVEEYLSKLQIDAAKLMQQQMGGGAAAPALLLACTQLIQGLFLSNH